MNLRVCLLLFCIVSYSGATEKRSENIDGITKTQQTRQISGFGMEILFTKINSIDRKLMEIQLELRQHRELIESNRASHEEIPTATPNPMLHPFTSCKTVPYNMSGVYLIRINNASSPFAVYCEMETFGGGWIVVQHRFDGSVHFNRNWDHYQDGFGELDKEFWLGLERIHQLTTARPHELVVEMKDFSGNYGYARYSAFQVGSESEHYSLKTVGSYSGTAGDSLPPQHKVRKFSTKDRDYDDYAADHSAVHWGGAWWYGDGNQSNLNGRYKDGVDGKSNWWYTFKNGYHGLSFSRMMIREL